MNTPLSILVILAKTGLVDGIRTWFVSPHLTARFTQGLLDTSNSIVRDGLPK